MVNEGQIGSKYEIECLSKVFTCEVTEGWCGPLGRSKVEISFQPNHDKGVMHAIKVKQRDILNDAQTGVNIY